MVNFKEALNEYATGNLELLSERGFIEGVMKIDEWSKLSDAEKIGKRKETFETNKYYAKDFADDDSYLLKLNYEGAIIEVSEMLMHFIDAYEKANIKDDLVRRIYVLFCCEVKLLNRDVSIVNINHIPIEVFEPLIEKVSGSEAYSQFELGSVFKKYGEMLALKMPRR